MSNRDGSRRMTVGRPESSPAIILLKIGQTGAQQTTDWGRDNVLACNMFASRAANKTQIFFLSFDHDFILLYP